MVDQLKHGITELHTENKAKVYEKQKLKKENEDLKKKNEDLKKWFSKMKILEEKIKKLEDPLNGFRKDGDL